MREGSVAARHAEHVLGEEGEDEVGRDRRHLIEPRLAILALDVVLLGKAEAAVGLQAGLGRRPGRLRGQHLGHVGLLAAALAGVERSEEHTSELQSLMRISYAVFCLKKKTTNPR